MNYFSNMNIHKNTVHSKATMYFGHSTLNILKL